MFRSVILVTLLALAGAPVVRAEAPTVTAVLSSSQTEVVRPVQLQINVNGDSEATPPDEIAVDGLEIHYSGQSTQIEGRGLRFSYKFVYNYTILPLKTGTFTIPPQDVRSSQGVLRTPALTLNVASGSGNGNAARNRRSGAIDESKLAFLEIVAPKTSAYVGEVVPLEVRFGLNTRVRNQMTEPPRLSGQGFTTQPLTEPKQSVETVGGINYQVFTFKTAISAARSGRLEIGPAEAKAVVLVPRRASSQNNPRDVFGMNDPFSDPFFRDPFSGMMEQRQIEVKSESTALEVKALPAPAPASFGGAVGIFNLNTEVKPKIAQVGDPLTVTATIAGRGNFDRVTAPTLQDEQGWHSYPPSASFKADDDVGLSGSKSFETVLTPNENKTAVPPLLFTYFDPLKESYVTLKSDPLPVRVEGGVAPAPATANTSATVPPPTARPTPAPAGSELLYQLTDSPRWVSSFAPVFERPIFWAAQGLPLLGLIGIFAWKTRQRRLANREGLQRAAWEQETAELQKKLRRTESAPDQYFAEALRVVQLKTALARRIEPNVVDAETAVSAFGLDAANGDRVRELFRQSDELRYSGRQNGHGQVGDATRRDVLDLIENLS